MLLQYVTTVLVLCCCCCCCCCRLVEAFGSTRRKRQLQARAEGTVVVSGNAAAAELDVMMQEVQRRAQAAGDTREEVSGDCGFVAPGGGGDVVHRENTWQCKQTARTV
jgi:hypothetical protein